ncbi:MAG: C39 family peptidase [Anaerolineales bacterium]|nr:C39 family peptidase [Anaerolineales bacterium]
MRNRKWLIPLLILSTLILLTVLLYQLPPIQDRLAWRIDNVRAKIKYAFNPPEEAIFIPQTTGTMVNIIVEQTLQAMTPSITPTPTSPPATFTPTNAGPTNTQIPTQPPTLTPTPIPEKVVLHGVIHEFQKWNNCGPANLSMALSYWDWQGDQRDTAAFLKPNQRDKNVMPYEMIAYVNEMTELEALWRPGGDLEMLKKLIAAGFPVIIEKGFEGPGFDGWMGHYELLSSYDDTRSRFLAQDSYIMPNLPVSYDDVQTYWQQFNYTFIVVYPPEREAEVLDLLGPLADETTSYQIAAQRASNEIFTTEGREKAFAWFNRGTNLVYLDDYAGAAKAYDEYFTLVATLDSNEVNLPWRNLWYQTGPYWAYFYTGRTYDVIDLATTTIEAASEPAIEESWYWRGLAKEALGDVLGAIKDLEKAVELNENFDAAQYHLNRLRGG